MKEVCPFCDSPRIIAIQRPEVYEYDYRCPDCDEGFDFPKEIDETAE